MKCKPTCAYRLSPTGLSRLMETFEDRTERIDAAAMALDLLIANIDTEKSFCRCLQCPARGCRAERRLFWASGNARAASRRRSERQQVKR